MNSNPTDTVPEKIHPKQVIRKIVATFPRDLDPQLRLAMIALYAYSQGFHKVEDLEEGYIKFKGSITYDQIAVFTGRSYSAAKRYCDQLNGLKMLTWTVGQHWINFTVCLKAAQEEFAEEDVKAQFEDSRYYTLWKPIQGLTEDGKAYIAAGTEQWVGGKCPYCHWDGEKRVGWCEDCYGEMIYSEVDGITELQFAFGEECPECGSSRGCWCEVPAEAGRS